MDISVQMLQLNESSVTKKYQHSQFFFIESFLFLFLFLGGGQNFTLVA